MPCFLFVGILRRFRRHAARQRAEATNPACLLVFMGSNFEASYPLRPLGDGL
jgi:hypothetical protein